MSTASVGVAELEAPGEEGWQARLRGELGPWGYPLNSTSIALEATRIVKAGAGTLYGLSGYSNRGTAQFIQVHDAASIPAAGAVPVLIIAVPATSNFNLYYGSVGRAFQHGCIVVNSTTAATYTAGLADTWFDVQYL